MSRIRRALWLVALCLLVAGLSGCAGSASGSTAGLDLKVVATRPAATGPRPAGSPVIVTASSGQRPAASPQAVSAAEALGINPVLRLPPDQQSVVVVDGTEGAGLRVRREPAGEALWTWPDGTPMLVAGADQEVEGRRWRHVWTLDGGSG